MWDFSGNNDCKKIRAEFYSENHAIVYCFDFNNLQTFNNIDNWVKESKQNGGDKLFGICLGIKSDLKKEVGMDMISTMCSKYKFQFLEVSSKFSESVNKFFDDLANAIFEGLSKDKKR